MSTTTLIFSPARLRRVAEQRGVSNRRMARVLADTSDPRMINGYATRVRRYANGHMKPSVTTLERLAEALGCDVKDLCVEVEL